MTSSGYFKKGQYQSGRYVLRPAQITSFAWEIFDTIEGRVEMASNSRPYLRKLIDEMAVRKMREVMQSRKS